MEAKTLYSLLYNSFIVKKMDRNMLIEGMNKKWTLLEEPFEIMPVIGG